MLDNQPVPFSPECSACKNGTLSGLHITAQYSTHYDKRTKPSRIGRGL
jgi:hypothetical protein